MSQEELYRLQEIEYVVQNLSPISTVIPEDDLQTDSNRIVDIIRLKMKIHTPRIPPRIIIYHHPGIFI